MDGGVLLINMPFSGVDRPQIGVSLLKAALQARNIPCDIRYFNHLLAEWVGPAWYQWYSAEVDHTIFAGEWVFAQYFFGDGLLDRDGYVRHLRHVLKVDEYTINSILHMQRFVAPFVQRCLASVDWDRYEIIGFTSTFEQNLASLALAQAIKERYPHKIIVMGGANCEDPMGLALHRCFPFVDIVFSGEADHGFPEFARRVARHERIDDIPGLVYRDGRRSVFTGPATPIQDMDALPVPDYEDYFAQRERSPLEWTVPAVLQIETSRGCWWGAKHHCTFCGLNAGTMRFRAKTKSRALDEILYLVSRYPSRQIAAVDNIMDVHYFRDVLPELQRRQLGLSLFYEVKANMTKTQVQLLADAGVSMIQPGIESLHGNILRLMRKGVTPLQNVQLLKWCAEAGVRPSWNLLYGFPGETAKDYEEMLPLLESLMHLQPPDGHGSIRLDRFSPYFEDPAGFGLVNARPLKVYEYLYPFSEEDLAQLAYFYQYDFADGQDPTTYIESTLRHLARWQHAASRRARLDAYVFPSGELEIRDSRPNAIRHRIILREWQKGLYTFCDQHRSGQTLQQWLSEHAPSVAEDEMRRFLDRLVQWRFMARDGDQYLSLAVTVYPGPQHTARDYKNGSTEKLPLGAAA